MSNSLFTDIREYFDTPMDMAKDSFDAIKEKADSAFEAAQDAISELSSFQTDFEFEVAQAPDMYSSPVFVSPGTVADPSTPTIPAMVLPTAPTFTEDSALTPGTAPEWDKPVGTITMPAAPGAIDRSGKPVRPAIVWDVTLPDDPALAMPILESMLPVTIPTFDFPTIPTFEEGAPTFTGTAPQLMADWSEPAYAPEIMPKATPVMLEFLKGKGLPPEVEQALFERGAEREDVTARQLKREAFNTWAARGFSMPPGMLVEQVNQAVEKAMLAKNTLSRDVLIKNWELMIENAKFGIQQALAAEQFLYTIYNNAIIRDFEMAKLRLDIEMRLYEAAIHLYNARMTAYQIQASVYKTKIEAEMMKVDVYKTELEGQRIIGELNMQKVQIFEAQVRSLLSKVEIYKAQMDGARVKAELIRSQLDAYKTDIEAYATDLNAQKVSIDVYKAQVEGEMAKVQLYEASARAFAAEVQAYSAGEDVKIKRIESKTQAYVAKVQAYSAQVQAARDKVLADVSIVKTQIDAFLGKVERNKAESTVLVANAQAFTAYNENKLRSNIALYEAQIKSIAAKMESQIHIASLQERAMEATAHAASAVAAGALSAMHVQSGYSANASLASNGQEIALNDIAQS